MPILVPKTVTTYFNNFSQVYCEFSENINIKNVNIKILRKKYSTQNAI